MDGYSVYSHFNKTNGKIYIGITKLKPKVRWGKGGKGYSGNLYFWRAIQKYGWNNFEHEIIASGLTKEEAENFEIALIREFDTTNREKGYNIAKGGMVVGSCSEETKEKMSKSSCGENATKRRKTVCEGKEFVTAKECAKYYGVNYNTLRDMLSGYSPMSKEWYDKGLRYSDKKMEDYKIQRGLPKGENNYNSKKVVCEGIEFCSLKEFSDHYNVNYSTVRGWSQKLRKPHKQFIEKGIEFI